MRGRAGSGPPAVGARAGQAAQKAQKLARGNPAEEGNVQPISDDGRAGIARLLAKALNQNQRLILEHLSEPRGRPITPQLATLSSATGVPLSTLKLNARILRELGLIILADHDASLTRSGTEVFLLLRDHVGQVLPIQEVKR